MEDNMSIWTTLDIWRARRAAAFAKWLMVYFWLQIAALVVTAFSVVWATVGGQSFVSALPRIGLHLAASMTLYKAGRHEDRFRTCAGLMLISGCSDLLLNLIGSGVAEYLWSIPLAIINEIFLFQFLYGCADILMEVNYDLTDNWRKLWKWHLIVIAAPIGSALLLIFAILFGMASLRLFVLPLLIVMAFGSIAVFVLQMVYLYQTVVCFRNWKPVDSRTGSIPD